MDPTVPASAAGELVELSLAWLIRERVLYPRQGCQVGRWVAVSGDAEEDLQLIDVPARAVPDRSFNVEVGLERDIEYLLSESELESLRWLYPDLVDVVDAADADER